MIFELSADLPIPVSVGERDGQPVLILREGAIVDASLVRAMNDLSRPDDDC